MTDKYPHLDIPPRDFVREAAEYAVDVMRASEPLIALPPRRLELKQAADELERVMKEKAT